jgi:hypothetical protein
MIHLNIQFPPPPTTMKSIVSEDKNKLSAPTADNSCELFHGGFSRILEKLKIT